MIVDIEAGGSGGSSGRAVGYQPGGPRFDSQSGSSQILLCVHPALNGYLGLLRHGESKGGEESKGKLPHNAVCQEQDPIPGSPMLGLSVGLYFLLTYIEAIEINLTNQCLSFWAALEAKV
ncbi:hypothetical protein PoB_001086100 [Plakobranchus ocellatus]|uniref:Uncharacterized protein n=1 Tax=Plakobranchus ocellatus TaxID=259542 RepID=A0AAV3YPL3_9GAST|nr:hypothetical protein PoB_001086100 [Plakobranchus ocellatus]